MNFAAGKREGKQQEFYENGNKKLESEFKNNKENGTWTVYFENGKVSTTFVYTDGLLNGAVVINDDKGRKIVEGNYKNGKEDGKWVFYDESGKVKKQENYSVGKKI